MQFLDSPTALISCNMDPSASQTPQLLPAFISDYPRPSDITLYYAGTVIPCHRLVLARSKTFFDFFEIQFESAYSLEEIVAGNWSKKSVEACLAYLYKGFNYFRNEYKLDKNLRQLAGKLSLDIRKRPAVVRRQSARSSSPQRSPLVADGKELPFLPPEVLSGIFAYTPRRGTLLSCMAVNRQWYQCAVPFLYKTISVYCAPDDMFEKSMFEKSRPLLTRSEHAQRYTRNLILSRFDINADYSLMIKLIESLENLQHVPVMNSSNVFRRTEEIPAEVMELLQQQQRGIELSISLVFRLSDRNNPVHSRILKELVERQIKLRCVTISDDFLTLDQSGSANFSSLNFTSCTHFSLVETRAAECFQELKTSHMPKLWRFALEFRDAREISECGDAKILDAFGVFLDTNKQTIREISLQTQTASSLPSFLRVVANRCPKLNSFEFIGSRAKDEDEYPWTQEKALALVDHLKEFLQTCKHLKSFHLFLVLSYNTRDYGVCEIEDLESLRSFITTVRGLRHIIGEKDREFYLSSCIERYILSEDTKDSWNDDWGTDSVTSGGGESDSENDG